MPSLPVESVTRDSAGSPLDCADNTVTEISENMNEDVSDEVSGFHTSREEDQASSKQPASVGRPCGKFDLIIDKVHIPLRIKMLKRA